MRRAQVTSWAELPHELGYQRGVTSRVPGFCGLVGVWSLLGMQCEMWRCWIGGDAGSTMESYFTTTGSNAMCDDSGYLDAYGNYGVLSDADCQSACLGDVKCNFALHRPSNSRCTGLAACQRTRSDWLWANDNMHQKTLGQKRTVGVVSWQELFVLVLQRSGGGNT